MSFVWYIFPCQIYLFIQLDPWPCLWKFWIRLTSEPLYKLYNFNNFLLTHSRSQNYWSYQLLIIVRPEGGSLFFLGSEVLPCSGCFITCMGAHFPAVELDNTIQFSTLFRMSGFLWHSSKWAHQLGHFLQYTLGREVFVCSLNNDLNYVTTMFQLCTSLNQSKVGATIRGKVWVYSHRQIHNPSSLSPGPKALN